MGLDEDSTRLVVKFWILESTVEEKNPNAHLIVFNHLSRLSPHFLSLSQSILSGDVAELLFFYFCQNHLSSHLILNPSYSSSYSSSFTYGESEETNKNKTCEDSEKKRMQSTSTIPHFSSSSFSSSFSSSSCLVIEILFFT